ncbi:MAG: ABC transporter ATP-binding protein [Limnochordia bacterium]
MSFIAEQLSYTYPGTTKPVLDAVSLTVHVGDTLGIVGESGSGKSTLARCLCGLLQPDAGRISLHGAPLSLRTAADRKAYYRAVQMVFQDPDLSLPRHLAIGIPLLDAARLRWAAADERRRQVDALLKELALPADVLKRRPRELSGGQRQRVAVARALLVSPAVLILDEPTSALDMVLRQDLLALLRSVRRSRGMAQIYISHDLDLIAQVADAVCVLHEGRIIEAGSKDAVLNHPKHDYTKRLLATVPTHDPAKPKILAHRNLR